MDQNNNQNPNQEGFQPGAPIVPGGQRQVQSNPGAPGQAPAPRRAAQPPRTQEAMRAQPGDAAPPAGGGAPPPRRSQAAGERTAQIRGRVEGDSSQRVKRVSRRKQRKLQMQDEAVEYYYDDDAAARRAGIGCLVAFLLAAALVLGVALYGWNWYKAEIGGDHATATGTVQLTVGSGYGASSVGSLLEDNGLISSGMVYRLYSRFITEDTPSYKAGTFEVQAGMSYDEIIEILSSADSQPEVATVTLIEGRTVMSYAKIFADAGFGTQAEFLAIADDLERFSDIELIARVMNDVSGDDVFHRSEGLMFPDTYDFYAGTDLEEIIRTLYQHMDSKFTEQTYERIDEMGLSVQEFITYASLVQAESGFVNENPLVAGVIWNRLNNEGTPYLDLDVTLRYVRQWMQWNYDEYWVKSYGDIPYTEAREVVGEHLYTNYVTISYGPSDGASNAREGLPTGPICSFNEAVLKATLQPEGEYYFFVTDAYNNYYYAVTSDEHNANVEEAKRMDAQWEEENAGASTEQDNEANEQAGTPVAGEDDFDDVNPDVYGDGDGDGE